MKIHALFLASILFGGSNAVACTPPTAAVSKLEAYFKYQHGLGSNVETQEHFTVFTAGDHVFFRHDNPPSDYEPSSRPVYVYHPTKGIDVANCPTGNEWVKCVGDYLRQDESSSGLKPDSTGACEFTLNVPQWHPSPDSPLKQRLATAILHEAVEFGDFSNPQAIYLRNFNVDDPDILVYVVTQRGADRFLGCSFDAAASQHCSWHRFGQTPLPALRQQIMEMPYQVYPSR
jgi:hypothetical protein